MKESADRSVRWVSAFETGYDYEADIVRDRLDENGIKAVVFTQRDHTWNLTIGNLAPIHVMVPTDSLDEALAVLADDEELSQALEKASDSADPEADPAHDLDTDSLLDSSIERLRFISPDDRNEDDAEKA